MSNSAIEMLRSLRPRGCDKCNSKICKQAVNGSEIDFGWCSACLAKYAADEWAQKEIVRRFVKRYGGES